MENSAGHYAVLGVSSTASDDEIKRAYRKLALRFHPDKNPETCDRFKEILAAYEVLSNEEKRALYDETVQREARSRREKTLDRQGFTHDIMEAFFVNNAFRFSSAASRCKNILRRVTVSLEDLYSGKTQQVIVTREVICPACRGTSVITRAVVECGRCGGTGETWQRRRQASSGPSRCQGCRGTGNAHAQRFNNVCTNCWGTKIARERQTLRVRIEPGMRGGDTITLPGEGNETPLGFAPDLAVQSDCVIVLQQLRHPVYELDPVTDDLSTTVRISPRESVYGFARTITTLDGREIPVTADAERDVIASGTKNYIPREGFPRLGNPSKRGNLVVTYEVVTGYAHADCN